LSRLETGIVPILSRLTLVGRFTTKTWIRQGARENRVTAPGRRSLFWIPLLGASLAALGAIGPYAVFDDHVLALSASGEPAFQGLPAPRWDLFTFTTGDAEDNRHLVEQGVMLPWWSDAQLKIAFYRPLSSLSHRIDYALWPRAPKLMVVHSLLWLALTLHLVVRFCQRLEISPRLALLSALLYAIDDTRGPVVAWISNRNALMATALGVLALLTHDRWRRHGHRLSGFLAPTWFLLALLSGEFALSTLAYLAAYALLLDEGAPWQRIKALVPYAAVVAAWTGLYVASEAGVHGSGTYISPLSDPGTFLAVLPERASVLVAAMFGPMPADLWLFDRPRGVAARLVAAAIVLGAAAWALAPALRRDRIARFWALGMLLSVIPVVASFPSDRLLMFAGIGGSALVARIVEPLGDGELRRAMKRPHALLVLVFGVVHVALSALLLPARAAQMQLIGRALDRATAHLDRVPALHHKTVVIVNAPVDPFASYIQLERATRGVPHAKRLFWLASSGSSATVRRTDAKTLTVERDGGFFSTPLERHYRGRPRTLGRGAVVQLSGMTAEVREVTSDGRPLAVSFRFAEELESSSYVFLIWRRDRYESLNWEELAQPLHLPEEDLGRILMRTAVREK
jgi:hypothetical protein